MSTCSLPECDRPCILPAHHYMHDRRKLRTGSPEGRRKQSPTCTVEGCEEPTDARDLCHGHYQRVKPGGDPNSTLRGYGRLCSVAACGRPHQTRGYCAAHYKRVLATGDPRADEPIGSQTAPGASEVVHHKNGIRDDNRIENLELWSTDHPMGQRVEDLVYWSLQILVTYRDWVAATVASQGPPAPLLGTRAETEKSQY